MSPLALLLLGEDAGPPPEMSLNVFNIQDYACFGDGTLVTTSFQNAHDLAYAAGGALLAPPGTYKVGPINYKHVPIIGAGKDRTVFLGLPGQDVFHVDPSLGAFASRGNMLKNFKVVVDDSAAGSFPSRGSVKAAGFAVDFANGAAATVPGFYDVDFSDVRIESTSLTVGGLNGSCGIYEQNCASASRYKGLWLWRLAYGFYQDYPTSNLATVDLGSDHNHYDSVFIDGCGLAMRLFNLAHPLISNLTIHISPTGLVVAAQQVRYRNESSTVTIDGAVIEGSSTPLSLLGGDFKIKNMLVQGATGVTFNPPVVLDCHDSEIDLQIGGLSSVTRPFVRFTPNAHRNKLELKVDGTATSDYGRDMVDDQAGTNVVKGNYYFSGVNLRRRVPEQLTAARTLHTPDGIAAGMGLPDGFVSGADLDVHPLAITPVSGTKGTNYDWLQDAAAKHSYALRILTGGAAISIETDYMNGTNGFVIGKFLPPGKVRVYILAKLATAGTQYWQLSAGGVNVGSGTLSFATTYPAYGAVPYFDADLTGKTPANALLLSTNAVGGGGAIPLDIGGIVFQPYFPRLLHTGIGARVYNSAAIVCATGAWTVLTFDSERFDTDGIHSTAANTSRLTCATAGQYHIFAHAELAAGGGGVQRHLRIMLNGATELAASSSPPAAYAIRFSPNTYYSLAAGDYVETSLYQDSGGNLNVAAAVASTPEFGMVRVG